MVLSLSELYIANLTLDILLGGVTGGSGGGGGGGGDGSIADAMG